MTESITRRGIKIASENPMIVLYRPDHDDSWRSSAPILDGYPTKFPAGERFYCNCGYRVLALLAERGTGVDYHELVTNWSAGRRA